MQVATVDQIRIEFSYPDGEIVYSTLAEILRGGIPIDPETHRPLKVVDDIVFITKSLPIMK